MGKDNKNVDYSQLNWQTESYVKPSRREAVHAFLSLTIVLSLIVVLGVMLPIFSLKHLADSSSKLFSALAVNIDPNAPLPEPSILLDVNGQTYATLYVQNRIPVKYEDIPIDAVHALVAAEDKNFWTNTGISWDGILRAIYLNVKEGKVVSGGSGLTQQYVKNLLIMQAKTSKEIKEASEQSLQRKLVEAATAVKLEETLSKKDIIENYFNTVYFGNNAYGIGAAASYYFGKKINELSLNEIAILIGSIQSPTNVNPVNNMEASVEREDYVLTRMVEDGYITETLKQDALREEVKLNITKLANGCPASKYAFYCEWVKETILNSPLYGDTVEEREKVLYQGGLTIKTALNPQIQDAADTVNRSAALSNNYSSASATVEAGTGNVLALSTSRVFGAEADETEIILPTVSEFKSGTVFKAAVIAAALEDGWSLDKVLESSDSYKGITNTDNAALGSMNLAAAVNGNSDTWFLHLAESVGLNKIANTASKMGLGSLPLEKITDDSFASMLGGDKVSVLEVANLYATIAAHGVACTPVGITSITSNSKDVLAVPASSCQQIIRSSTADTLTGMLASNMVSGSGVKGNLDRPVAGMSGSAGDHSAIWFAGFTPQLATALWIGDYKGGFLNPVNNVSIFGETFNPAVGSNAAAVLWQHIMAGQVANMPSAGFTPSGGDTVTGVIKYVPNVKGLSADQAVKVLEKAGYTVKVKTFESHDNRFPSGIVLTQTPKVGSQVDSGDMMATITINQ